MKRKVCIFCETWESGGIESFLHNVLMRMDLAELEIDIVAAQLRESVFTQELQALGVHFIELSGNQRRILTNYNRFRTLLAEKKYDVVHLNIFQGMSLYYARMAARAGVPGRIAHSHNTALRKSAGKCLKMLLHRLFSVCYASSATELWACSGAAARFMFPSGLLRRTGYQFIPNGIDTERFRFRAEIRERVRRELGLDGKFVVGHVGRLCYQKNQSFLLDVFAKLIEQRSESVLLLVGEGEDRAMLEDRVRQFDLTERVIFCGASRHVEQLMWAMDVFAFPSRFEGLPLVGVEVQAAGLPVVCTDSNIPPEAGATPSLIRIPLESGAAAWAAALLNAKTVSREEAARLVREAGFDVADVARQVERAYLR